MDQDPKQKEQVMLKTNIISEFVYPVPPANENEILARERLNNELKKISVRLQKTVQGLIIDIMDMRHADVAAQAKRISEANFAKDNKVQEK